MPHDDAPGETTDEYGPFGLPIFDDPEARALSRVAVIDIGSNSIRMVVFDGAARSPAYFFNEKVMAGLGAGFHDTGRLNPEGRVRALAAMRRFAHLARGMGAAPIITIATAAMREAKDGPAFRTEIEAATGLSIRIIDGAEEARLSAQGVLLGWPEASGLVSDIGGSSMELARVGGGRVSDCVTSPLGPLRLQGIGGARAVRAEIARATERLAKRMGSGHDRLYLVGGSWRAIAKVDMARRDYPLRVLHEYRLSRPALAKTLDHIDAADPADLRNGTGIGEARAALLPLAAQVLRALIDHLDPTDIAVSSYGIREGVLYDQMPQMLRDRDPLIESCRFAEAKDARQPGFGRVLYRFVAPLFAGMPEARLRIVRAACLLHDVNWRSHPDYRHEVCFDSATRANLGGLTHEERVFLGLALLHRYKGSRSGTRIEGLIGILDDTALREAEILGRAMRFGAMFAGPGTEPPATLALDDKGRITLTLGTGTDILFTEAAEGRWSALLSAMGAEGRVERAPG